MTDVKQDLKQLILDSDDRPCEDVVIPEWGGGKYRVRGLSAKETDAFIRKHGNTGEKIPKGMMVDLVSRTLEDPTTGERIFENEEEAEALGEKSGKVIADLFKVAQELSGLGNLEEAKKG